jgi:hypothetical protein
MQKGPLRIQNPQPKRAKENSPADLSAGTETPTQKVPEGRKKTIDNSRARVFRNGPNLYSGPLSPPPGLWTSGKPPFPPINRWAIFCRP